MRRYAGPIELRIEIGKIGRRSIAELLVHPDFFEFVTKRIGFAQIMRIAELADETGGGKRVNSIALATRARSAGFGSRNCRPLQQPRMPIVR